MPAPGPRIDLEDTQLRFVPRRRRTFALAVVAFAVLVSSGIAGAQGRHAAPSTPPSPRQQQFTAAAGEFGVPEPVLLAVSYALTRWEDAKGAATDTSGGFGPMHLTAADGHAYAAAVGPDGGQGTDLESIIRSIDTDPALHTLEAAAALVRMPPGQLSRDAHQNIRAGAALLASYAGTPRPAGVDGWYDAVARYAGGGTETAASKRLADSVFDVLRTGASAVTTDGQRMVLVAQSAGAGASGTAAAAQCPAGLACRFVQAAGYDSGQRAAGQVRYLVLGSAGTTYEQGVSRMADPRALTSAHYLVRATDGQVTQLVRGADVAWFTPSPALNAQSIGIGLDSLGGAGLAKYSEPTYASAAALVKYLAATYRVPLDRQHVIGRDELPTTGTPQAADPGARWDWEHFFALLGAPLAGPSDDFGRAVAFVPRFAGNTQPVRQCAVLGMGCADLGRQQVNYVPLHAAPSDAAPLLSDAGAHPDGAAGTADLADYGDKAVTGQVFAIAERRPGWTAIWYGGQRGWFRDAPGTTRQVRSTLVTPAPGLGGIDVFTDPAGLPDPAYTLAAGQSYPLLGRTGGFDIIGFNHRIAFVRTADVSVWPG
jgi:hypothetical protein